MEQGIFLLNGLLPNEQLKWKIVVLMFTIHIFRDLNRQDYNLIANENEYLRLCSWDGIRRSFHFPSLFFCFLYPLAWRQRESLWHECMPRHQQEKEMIFQPKFWLNELEFIFDWPQSTLTWNRILEFKYSGGLPQIFLFCLCIILN